MTDVPPAAATSGDGAAGEVRPTWRAWEALPVFAIAFVLASVLSIPFASSHPDTSQQLAGGVVLEVSFGVVNHSEADLGDLTLDVNLRTTTAKPQDPPLCEFPVKVPSLGPEELKQVSELVPTKLRVYELPDWQYLKADFAITEPK